MKISLKTAETCLLHVIILASITMLFLSCRGRHLIVNKDYLNVTQQAYSSRRLLANNRDSALFTVFKKNLSVEQSEALKFLYAFMPLSDLADYDGNFFLSNINFSIKALSDTKWGMDIPVEIYLHYVLPIRINNENLDSFRIIFYDELINRVKGKVVIDAALEVNHWCHEKVTYQPSDIRTSSPVNTIRSARGRCGEESTFTVSALRTVGIPARQVYTPRWAHSDDNHAWVEVWINGNWYYMGACEPEPVLDRGWFTEPSRRAMLVHSKSFGAYSGGENVINRNNNYTNINNLSKYAITKRIYVKVIDNKGLPVNNAKVEYQLYNYSEFFPLAVVPTDNFGLSQFETGLGDLLIWAHKDDDFDFKKISVNETDTLVLKLNANLPCENSLDLDLDVPLIRTPLPGPSQELNQSNSERINNENMIRQRYLDSWTTPSESKKFAINLKTDTTRVMNIIARSMGNFAEIRGFLSVTPDTLLGTALSLLEILPDKDLRDTRCHILSDHLINGAVVIKAKAKAKAEGKTEAANEEKFILDYVLNPRISNEMLVAWRQYFLKVLPSDFLSEASKDPSTIIRYLDENIKISDDENYYGTPLTPVGVNELKVSDKASRAICYVAICRSLGIPARLEPGRNEPQYFRNGNWNDVYFSDQKKPDLKKGYLKLSSADKNPIPEYYIHFTLARFEGGRYNTLEYDFNRKITDFKEELALPPGRYMLVTGNRLSDSKILSNITFFNLSENEHKTLDVKIRKNIANKTILAYINLKSLYSLLKDNSSSQNCTKDKGNVIIWIDPEKEPSKHIFNDLPLLKAELDSWGGKFIFLSDSLSNGNSFNSSKIRGLPANTSFGIDNKFSLLRENIKFTLPPDADLPVVVVTDKSGAVFYISTGYRIGIGEQILKYVK
jgi:hypothetical protein